MALRAGVAEDHAQRVSGSAQPQPGHGAGKALESGMNFTAIDKECAMQHARLAQETGLSITNRQAAFMILAKRFAITATRNSAEGLVTELLNETLEPETQEYASQEA